MNDYKKKSNYIIFISGAKPAAKTPRGRKPKAQDLEPVVLTLSSDDEDSVPKSPVIHLYFCLINIFRSDVWLQE